MSQDEFERLIPFTPDLADKIKEMAREDGRAFKRQVAALVKEAVEARENG